MKLNRRYLLALPLAFSCLIYSPAHAEDGVTADTIVIGSSLPLTEKTAPQGLSIKRVLEIYWDKVNSQGGVNGRKVKLLIADDAFTAQRAVANTEKFINQDKVFAIAFSLGTPTVKACLPLIQKSGIPFLAPFTTAEFLRSPVIPNVFNLTAGAFESAEDLIVATSDKTGKKKVGILHDSDALGALGKGAISKALLKRNMNFAVAGVYTRGTAEVDKALAEVIKAKPEIMILWGQPQEVLAFMRKAKAQNYTPVYGIANSGVSDEVLEELKTSKSEAYISLTVPWSKDESLQVMRDYRADLKAAGANPDIDSVSVQAYLSARLVHEALKRTGADLTRKKLIDTMNQMHNVDAGGVIFNFSPTNHQALKSFFLLRAKDGTVAPFAL